MTLRVTIVAAALAALALAVPAAARADVFDTPNGRGALAGKTIVVSPGHGIMPDGAGGWQWQRAPTPASFADDDRVREDIHTNEIVIEYLQRYLSNAGAVVFSCRERGFAWGEAIIDDADPGHSETGAWSASTSAPSYKGASYRFAAVATSETAVSRFAAFLPESGDYPVYVWYTPSPNRSRDALYRVQHVGGTTEVRVDQSLYRATWFYLGTFPFDAGVPAVVELSNRGSDTSKVVIADAVRFGGGVGASGEPRWKESAKAFVPYVGFPDTGYNDVVIRPIFADWLAGNPAGAWRDDFRYLAVHSNAGTGASRGTMTISYSNGRTPSWAGYGTGPQQYPVSPSPLQDASDGFRDGVQEEVLRDLRAAFGTWNDRGLTILNLGELREALAMPSTLCEIAFHDNVDDVAQLKDARFRHLVARALYKGVARSFDPAATILPLPPAEVRVENAGGGRVRVSWSGVLDPLEPSASPASFRVYASADGRGFDAGTATAASSALLGPFAAGETVYVRVAAVNAGGESLPSRVCGARVSANGAADVLVVDGFTRAFTHSYKNIDARYGSANLVPHGQALAATALAFDGADRDCVTGGQVALGVYPMVDWFCGQNSTADETLSGAAQGAVSSYLGGGGRLLLSGAEIGWDLSYHGAAADQAFYRDVLRAAYVADDAGTRDVGPVAGSTLALVPSFTLHDGTRGSYEVRYPDVIAPGARGAPALAYGNGAGTAAIEVEDGFRLVYLGFPFEGVAEPGARAALVSRAADFLLAGGGGTSGGSTSGGGTSGGGTSAGGTTTGGTTRGGGSGGRSGGGGGGCVATSGAPVAGVLPLGALLVGLLVVARRRAGGGRGLR